MKVVIVGGVAGGATAAARLRRLDEKAEIVVFERTGYVSYANCGLPYYVGGVINDSSALTLQTPQSFQNRFRVDMRVNSDVTEIDRAGKTVAVTDLQTGKTYRESYDKLILAPGARPVNPNFPGGDSKRLFVLRTVEDTFRLHDFVDTTSARSATVVGGGFIGLEVAENLRHRGLQVTLVEGAEHVLPTLDRDMAAILQNRMRSGGIDLILEARVSGFEDAGDQIVTTVGEQRLTSDLVVLAIGVQPETTLAKAVGLELGVRDSIKVDRHMRTSDPDIYAVGDAVEIPHFVTGAPSLIALAGPANKQGRIAADHICGIEHRFAGAQGTSILKMFDLTVATTGLTEKAALAAGFQAQSVVLSPSNHAGYYPGAESMVMKVTFEQGSGRILGAQIAGGAGTDKRIDVLATAIRANMTAFDLTELDLAYSPPFGSAKDPVNMAGYVMENILEQRVKQVTWDQVQANRGQIFLLDVRSKGEYAAGNVEGAVNIPLDQLRDNLDKLPKDQEIYVHCKSGARSYMACQILSQAGFNCANVAGGYDFLAEELKNR